MKHVELRFDEICLQPRRVGPGRNSGDFEEAPGRTGQEVIA